MIFHIWRHPKPMNTEGICIGQTDVGVDKRKLKRLANKIERFVRLHQLPKTIWVSPLQRSLKVGQILAQRGFECRVAPELAEINFGEWDGCRWAQITKQEIDEWCHNFAHFSPSHGESLQQLFERVEGWLVKVSTEQKDSPVLVIGHAGWINAAKIIAADQEVPKTAAEWPRSVAYLSCNRIDI
ncbi:histidine phosphatase family protein [Psychrobacter glacincola]|uniref:histidine phosphatase family protein n=1 Tax=Psychrobacter glacincola TaxID=56810 RepID=UPI003D093887